MNCHQRNSASSMTRFLFDAQYFLDRLDWRLSAADKALGILAPLRGILAELSGTSKRLREEIERIFGCDTLKLTANVDALNVAKMDQLLTFNRNLTQISEHLRVLVDESRPALEEKVGDPADPLVNYEIVAFIFYLLHPDDPEFVEGENNFLSARENSIKHLDDCEQGDRFYEGVPKAMQSEPLCWLFKDLVSYRQGLKGPRVSFSDCLRIGSVFVEVQIRQQYDLDIQRGKWVKSRA